MSTSLSVTIWCLRSILVNASPISMELKICIIPLPF